MCPEMVLVAWKILSAVCNLLFCYLLICCMLLNATVCCMSTVITDLLYVAQCYCLLFFCTDLRAMLLLLCCCCYK